MGRPFELDPLFRSLTAVSGIGPKNAKLFSKLTDGAKIVDLLWHLPVDFVDRSFSPLVKDAINGEIATITVKVQKYHPSSGRGRPYRVTCADETGTLSLVFFHARKDWIEKQLPVGAEVVVSGRVEFYQGHPQIVHPDMIADAKDKDAIQAPEPVYPLTAGLTNRQVRKAVQNALGVIPRLPEWLDTAYKQKNKWPDWHRAVEAVHTPSGEKDLSPFNPARQRLAYDELLANQIALALVRLRQKKLNGRAWNGSGILRKKVMAALPFKLTGAQSFAMAEIDGDMAAPLRMLRLLQGDVGSGKTIVAVMAMLNVIECGAQAAIMAPTEILARQHAQNVKPWLDAAGVKSVVLTGRDKGKARDALMEQIQSGEAQAVIGTHSLFQEGVEFANLGLAVIDEQHRFGVHQRLQLSSKGTGTDVLVMTATPIPRTLTLTAYGDMDVSRLNEKPPGRKPIDTLLIPHEKTEAMMDSIARQIEKGSRVYWVCPLVEESEVLDLAAAEERYDILKARFGDKVGLVHGRLKPDEKDEVMRRFAKGDLCVLVATTVIEVGVDVPEANIMVVEHAERFGLAQLHQLRGRVGRGAAKSFCFLVYSLPLTQTAKERLKTLRDTEDGFVIAEKDLELRGGGEILGTRQSGMPVFRLADLAAHGELLAAARDDAKLVLDMDPGLEGGRGKHLKYLLYLHEQDQAIANLRAG